MPWRATSPMTQRRDFIDDYRRALYSMMDLCAHYGISRRVGYKWIARYETFGYDGLVDARRTPRSCPHCTPDAIVELVLAARRAHPTWGPRKLIPYLARRHPGWQWPAPSTVGEILKRHGLVRKRRRRPRPGHPGRPTTPMDAPNAVWTADFKGQFKTRDGEYCYPLTVVDGYSRFLLACQALPGTLLAPTRATLVQLFREYGLPEHIRTDNGVPFATCALGRLSRLSAWWIRLGITPELIEPAHPEQNGRHERFHKTLKGESTRPAAATRTAQQRRFTRFRHEYNTERPHEALGQQPPAELYTPSPRPYPRRLPPLEYPAHYEVRLVSANGGIRWRSGWVNCSHILAGEYVGFDEVDDGIWAVYFGPTLLGRFHERTRAIIGTHNRNRLRNPRK
ncbi:MAG: IS481 family transposase [Planctomycetota bacterium]